MNNIKQALESVSEVLPLGNMTNTPEAIQEHIRKSMPNVSKELVALMTSPSIQECVNRFLSWKLPIDFAPDCGIEFNANNKFEPTGTNLFTADQAKEMIKHILAGAHVELNAPTVQREGWVSVPIEPTEEMINAMTRETIEQINCDDDVTQTEMNIACYKAMIHAAPTDKG